jgi:hypothetical protein
VYFQVSATNNKMIRVALAAVAAFFVTGCTLTLPVSGQFDDGSATITGTATGHMDHSGTLQLQTSTGLKVTGVFVYTTPRTGEGTFTCSDGRSGPFQFVSTGNHGTGTGQLGNEKITFTFGN